MACCRRRGAAMSYRGDYRQRRLLTGHFITVTGREEGEEGERKRRGGQKNRKRSKKNTIGRESRGRRRGREGGTDSLQEMGGNTWQQNRKRK